MAKHSPSHEFLEALRQSVDYDEQTGLLAWKIRDEKTFVDRPGKTAKAAASAFNKSFAGKCAFSTISTHGYLVGGFLGKRLYAHQVAYFLVRSVWPSHNIDHIDGNKINNTPSNLRDVSQSINLRNAIKPQTNTSGILGVYEKRGKWLAFITLQRKKVHLGTFASKGEAVAARKAADALSGFTSRHGE